MFATTCSWNDKISSGDVDAVFIIFEPTALFKLLTFVMLEYLMMLPLPLPPLPLLLLLLLLPNWP